MASSSVFRGSLVFSLLWAAGVCFAEELSQDEARSIADRTLVERSAILSDFAQPKVRQAPNGAWIFTYACRAEKGDCQIRVAVPGKKGRVIITSEADEAIPDRISDEIAELVFTQEIGRRKYLVACLEIDGSGPSADLLEKLKKTGAVAVDYSECKAKINTDSGSYHEPTGKAANFYRLSHMKSIDATHATIELQTYRNGLDAEGVTFFLEAKNGTWVIQERKSNWIS